MMKRALLIAFLIAFSVSGVFAQFTLKGEFRPRFEYRDGYGKILTQDQNAALTASMRTRLSAYYQTGILSFGLSFQDVRIWGDANWYGSTGNLGDSSSIDLNEGWFAIKPYKNGMIKIGRQYWSYEDERLLSSRGWNQSEVKYDAILFQHSQDKLQIDLGLSWNNAGEKLFNDVYPSNKMRSLNFIYIKKGLNDWLNVSAIGIMTGFNDNDTTTNVNWMQSYGAYLTVKRAKLSGQASGYIQAGTNRFTREKTMAYMFAVNADYKILPKFSAGAGIDYLSGDNDKSTEADYSDKTHAFDLLYGIRHRLYGHLDYFGNVPSSTKNAGLVDIFLKLKYLPTPSLALHADYHYFSLQNNKLIPANEIPAYYDKGLGHELDLYTSWDLNKIFNIRAGYSFFVASETMKTFQGVSGNAKFPTWVWVMVTAKPLFLEIPAK